MIPRGRERGGALRRDALVQVGQRFAAASGTKLTVTDLAPTASTNPNGTIEFYAIVFLAIGSALGATVLGRVLGTVAALTPYSPHGGGLSVLRGGQYFDGRGIAAGVGCLVVWAAVGLLLLAGAAVRTGLRTRTAAPAPTAGQAPALG
ncbi:MULTISPECIES: hypothetical protein [Frankia]|uniref:Uncharacterized protein n=1 Tax=Frankia alni (strain DSM 45986 / CECT 9034 / ACN14a) TaxID=326424 RepID=Q0REF9_FRAAA|nr:MULTISPECIES: hypothetical protein [Frankia]CAJ64151.1 hypothetical protein FRAAL5518 [Frankia alni ACN14a]